MPQQICSLCCDKINDFYEFREMCAATNEQTRKLLRLPDKPMPKKVIAVPSDDDDEGAESIFGVLGGDEPEEKFDPKATKKLKKGIAKKAARTTGKVKRETADDGSEVSIVISDEDADYVPKKRVKKKKGNEGSSMALLLAPKELNERERQRELEQKKNEIEHKKKTKYVLFESRIRQKY